MSRKAFVTIMRTTRSLHHYIKVLLLCTLWLAFAHLSAANVVAAPPAQSFTPFLDIVPNANGSRVDVTLRDSEVMSGTEIVATFTDPTGFKEGWTGTYSTVVESHIFVDAGHYTPSTTMTNSLEITTSNGLVMDPLIVNRSFLPAQTSTFALSGDNQVELTIFNDDTFDTDTYVVIVNDPAPPGAIPSMLHLIGNSYSVRASGHILDTESVMGIVFRFTEEQLGAIDPHTLAIYKWDINSEQWRGLPPSLFDENGPIELSIQTNDFATYAALAQPVWRALLDNSIGLDLDQSANVFVGTFPTGLQLDSTPGDGVALSTIITPAFGLQGWDTIEFSGTWSAPATDLTVDVLDADGALLLGNVTSGQSLATIDPVANPSLRLRANLTSTVANQSPLLTSWGVSWNEPPQAEETENAATPASRAAAPATGLTIQTNNAAAAVGETVAISLTLANAPAIGISGATLDVSYDPALLQLAGCTPLALDGAITTCNDAFDSDAVAPDSARVSFIVSPALTLATTVAQLDFTLLSGAAGEAAIDVAAVRVTDGAGISVTAQARGSVITIENAPTSASGDVNCDDAVDISDVELIIDYEAGLVQAGASCPLEADQLLLAACDLNQDGACTLQDAWLILP